MFQKLFVAGRKREAVVHRGDAPGNLLFNLSEIGQTQPVHAIEHHASIPPPIRHFTQIRKNRHKWKPPRRIRLRRSDTIDNPAWNARGGGTVSANTSRSDGSSGNAMNRRHAIDSVGVERTPVNPPRNRFEPLRLPESLSGPGSPGPVLSPSPASERPTVDRLQFTLHLLTLPLFEKVGLSCSATSGMTSPASSSPWK